MVKLSLPPYSIRSDAATLRDKFEQLSPAQRRVLLAVSDGSANERIAYDLAITEAIYDSDLQTAKCNKSYATDDQDAPDLRC
jgi:FixJ family two-component response regulator